MKSRRWLVLLLMMAMLVSTSFAVVACNKTKQEGPETGVYYYDDGTEENQLALYDGEAITLLVGGASKTGKYTLEGELLTLVFSDEETYTGAYKDDVIILTYADQAEIRFLRKTFYTVTFNSMGGVRLIPSAF